MIYALDANIVSYFIQNNEHVITQFRTALTEGAGIVIPPVTYYEIRRGFKHKSAPKKEKAFSRMCTLYPVGEMSLAAWECASEIYGSGCRSGKRIPDDDILIAAFCRVNDYTLVTSNVRHFEHIDDLRFVNWMIEPPKKVAE